MHTVRSILAACILGAASLDAAAGYISGGHQYDLACTKDGYQLKSKHPVSRAIGSGAGTRYITERETLFLGRSCDAYLKPFGYGSWCWGNGGFVAEFDEDRIGFPRQELWCERERDYEMNCSC